MKDPKEMATLLLKTHSEQTFKVQPYAGATPITEQVGYEAGKKSALIDVQNTIDALKELVPPGTYSIYDDTWANVKDKIHFLNQVKEHIKQV